MGDDLLDEDNPLNEYSKIKWFVSEEGDIVLQGDFGEEDEITITALDLSGMAAGLAQFIHRVEED